MAIFTSISRFTGYFKRHGLGPTLRRTALATKRALFSNHAVLFYCDLSRQPSPSSDFPKSLKVERKRSFAEVDPQDSQQIIHVWNPKLAQGRMEERFDRGASLWLIKFADRLAGYGWTLQGRAIAPYYFPLAEDDVQFLDFYVFPKYRGRAIDWFLMSQVLQRVAADGAARAFAEAAEWNKASLSSIGMTSFRRLGLVRKVRILGRTIVWWAGDERPRHVREHRSGRRSVVAADRKTSDVSR